VYFRQIEAQLGAGVQDIRGSDRSDPSKVKVEMNCTYYLFYSLGCMHKKTFQIITSERQRCVEIRKCPQTSYLKKDTCPYKILLVLFLFKHSILANTVACS
jgi:hypothetical protein